MVNILIADDNLNFSKNLINDITDNIDIRICKLSTNGRETLDILNNEDIDVIILDINMPILNGIDVLNRLSDLQKEKYKESIIIMTGYDYYISQLNGNSLVYDYIIKGTEKDRILSKIKGLIENKNLEQKRKEIINELKKIGYDMNYKGTTYLIESILQMCINKKAMLDNLQKDVYPVIAKVYHKTIHNIKCNINNATDLMYCKCDIEILKEYFKFNDDTKPTTKTVIYTVLNKIS